MQLMVVISTVMYEVKGRHPSIFIICHIPDNLGDMNDTLAMQTHAVIIKSLPHFLSLQPWQEVKKKYGHLFGSNVPPGLLKMIHDDIGKNSAVPHHLERENQLIHYVMSCGNPDMYPDLQASWSGSHPKYEVFFDMAQCVIDDGTTGATPYWHGEQCVITPLCSYLTSIPAFYHKICLRMDNSMEEHFHTAPRPSKQLLRTSCCPQHPLREIASSYNGQLNIT